MITTSVGIPYAYYSRVHVNSRWNNASAICLFSEIKVKSHASIMYYHTQYIQAMKHEWELCRETRIKNLGNKLEKTYPINWKISSRVYYNLSFLLIKSDRCWSLFYADCFYYRWSLDFSIGNYSCQADRITRIQVSERWRAENVEWQREHSRTENWKPGLLVSRLPQ